MAKLLRYEPHSHCGRGSNLRLLDSINRPEDLTCGGYHWMYVDDNGNRVQK